MNSCLGLRVGKLGVTTNNKVSFGEDENVLKLTVVVVCATENTLKKITGV